MFNFIAAALMTYLLVNVLIRPGQQIPETRDLRRARLAAAACTALGRVLGLDLGRSPLNFSLVLGAPLLRRRLGLIWRTRSATSCARRRVARPPPLYGGITPGQR